MNSENQDATRLNRRALLGGTGSIALASSLISSAQAQTATSDEGPPKPTAAQNKAITSMETWAGSLALQAATYAAPLVAMYNLRATVAVGPKP